LVSLMPSKKPQTAAARLDAIPLHTFGSSNSLTVPGLDEDSASDYEYMPEDGLLYDHVQSQRSLSASHGSGFLGKFFFRTSVGEKVYLLLLLIMLVALESATVVTNRLIWMSMSILILGVAPPSDPLQLESGAFRTLSPSPLDKFWRLISYLWHLHP